MRMILLTMLLVGLGLSLPAVADAVWERGVAQYRVGLMVGEADEEEVAALKAELRDRLADSDGALVVLTRGPRLNAAAGEEYVVLLNRGRNLYFFEGAGPARSFLEAEVDRFLDISRPWMGVEGFSAAAFEVGLYLVRAHFDLGDEAAAQQLLLRLVQTFPAHGPDENSFPPAIVEAWEAAQTSLTEGVGSLKLTPLKRRGECEVWINGGRAKESTQVLVAERSYLVSYRCAEQEERSHLWLRVPDGATRALVPLDGHLTNEELAWEFEVVRVTNHLDAVVYVGAGACEEGSGEGLCVGAESRSRTLGLTRLDGSAAERIWAVVRPR